MANRKLPLEDMELAQERSVEEPLEIFLVSYLYEPEIHFGMGGFQKVFDLARALGQRHHVTLFLPLYSRQRTEIECVWVPLLNLPLVRVLSFNLFLVFLMLSRSLRGRPDILYCRIFNSVTPPLMARLLGAYLIVEINGDPLQYYQEHDSFKTRWVRRLVKWNLGRSRKVVALTEGLRKMLGSQFDVEPFRIHMAPSGSDPSVFYPRDRLTCREALGLPEEGVMAVFSGTFFAYQGVDVLLTALADPRLKDLNVWLLGEGEKRVAWESMARKMGLGRVNFTGQVEREQVALYVGAANFCLAPFSPDRGEVSPLKVLDYLFCARAAAVSQIPSVENLLQEFSSLVSFAPGSPSSLAEVLVRMMGESKQLDSAASRDSERARSRYSWQSIALEIERNCF